jgi:NAD+ synthase
MSGQSDEDKIGFTYDELDTYLDRRGPVDSESIRKIEKLHTANKHKLLSMPTFYPHDDSDDWLDK